MHNSLVAVFEAGKRVDTNWTQNRDRGLEERKRPGRAKKSPVTMVYSSQQVQDAD